MGELNSMKKSPRIAGDQGQPVASMAGTNEQQTFRFWNVVVTARDHEQRHLARLVKRLGDFWWTPFLGVLVGRVEDHEAFCGQLCRNEEERPGFLRPLARLIPIDRTVTFQVEHLPAQLERAVLAYADRIDSGSFVCADRAARPCGWDP